MAHHGSHTNRAFYQAGKFAAGVPAPDRHDAVMPTDWMKPQRERREPQSADGEPAPAEIADHDRVPCHSVTLAQQCFGRPVIEVMEHL